jgi:outer membrane protein OmpA-like peptidoglycan-associated protein
MTCPPIRRGIAGRLARVRAAIKWWLLAGAGIVGTLVIACGPSGTPDTVIIAASATANEPTPVLSAPVLQMLRSAGTVSTRATAYVVAPGTGQPTVIALTPHRADGQVDYGPARDQTLNASLAAVQRAVQDEAARGPFDLLNTMATAVRVASAPATLILISSGVSTAGGLDMRQVGWDASPRWVAAQLKARGLLPDLAGYRVIFSGLADIAGQQPTLPLPQRTTLISYWLAICQAGGAASCAVDETTRPDPPPHSTISVPVVPVPTVVSVHAPHGVTTTSLPTALLFSFNSATLFSSADSILQPIADQAMRQHLRVSITGRASPDGGTTAYNTALSLNRAIAVRNRLIALGLPADQFAKVQGVGTASESPKACFVHGRLDEAICAQMRRVVIVLSPAATNP